jgi:hypothetical protein
VPGWYQRGPLRSGYQTRYVLLATAASQWRKGGAPGSLLPPSEPGLASLQGSLSKGLATEYQMSDRERLIAVEPGDFRGESVFSP